MRINRSGSGLGLEITVIYELYGDPKYLVRLDKHINSSETAKQSLRMKDEGLVFPKESGRKRCKSEKAESVVQKLKHSRSLLNSVLANDKHQIAIYVTCEVHGVRFIESQNNKIFYCQVCSIKVSVIP